MKEHFPNAYRVKYKGGENYFGVDYFEYKINNLALQNTFSGRVLLVVNISE